MVYKSKEEYIHCYSVSTTESATFAKPYVWYNQDNLIFWNHRLLLIIIIIIIIFRKKSNACRWEQ